MGTLLAPAPLTMSLVGVAVVAEVEDAPVPTLLPEVAVAELTDDVVVVTADGPGFVRVVAGEDAALAASQ